MSYKKKKFKNKKIKIHYLELWIKIVETQTSCYLSMKGIH